MSSRSALLTIEFGLGISRSCKKMENLLKLVSEFIWWREVCHSFACSLVFNFSIRTELSGIDTVGNAVEENSAGICFLLQLHSLNTLLLLLLLLLLLHPFDGLFFRTIWISRYQKGKTSLDLNEASDDGVRGYSGISWTICKQSAFRCREITTPTPRHLILQAGCSSWCPTNSVKALKANALTCNSKEGWLNRNWMCLCCYC